MVSDHVGVELDGSTVVGSGLASVVPLHRGDQLPLIPGGKKRLKLTSRQLL